MLNRSRILFLASILFAVMSMTGLIVVAGGGACQRANDFSANCDSCVQKSICGAVNGYRCEFTSANEWCVEIIPMCPGPRDIYQDDACEVFQVQVANCNRNYEESQWFVATEELMCD